MTLCINKSNYIQIISHFTNTFIHLIDLKLFITKYVGTAITQISIVIKDFQIETAVSGFFSFYTV